MEKHLHAESHPDAVTAPSFRNPRSDSCLALDMHPLTTRRQVAQFSQRLLNYLKLFLTIVHTFCCAMEPDSDCKC